MAEAIARATLNKARYFLAQAELHQSDPNITAYRLPFIANLEAAIIYGKSVLEHLRNEFAPKHPAYRAWHDATWKVLVSVPVFERFSDGRNFILHREPERTNAVISVSVHLAAKSEVSVEGTVIRADGTVEPAFVTESDAPQESYRPVPMVEPSRPEDGQTFYFEDADWKAKPAIQYVREFLNLIGPVVDEAEARFLL